MKLFYQSTHPSIHCYNAVVVAPKTQNKAVFRLFISFECCDSRYSCLHCVFLPDRLVVLYVRRGCFLLAGWRMIFLHRLSRPRLCRTVSGYRPSTTMDKGVKLALSLTRGLPTKTRTRAVSAAIWRGWRSTAPRQTVRPPSYWRSWTTLARLTSPPPTATRFGRHGIFMLLLHTRVVAYDGWPNR